MVSQRKIVLRVKQRQEGRKMPKRLLWMITIFLCGLFVLAGYRDSNAAARSCLSGRARGWSTGRCGGIPAGEAVIEILPCRHLDGVRTQHFAMTMTTNSRLEMFYKVRERQESYTDIPLTRTLQYRKKSPGITPGMLSSPTTGRTGPPPMQVSAMPKSPWRSCRGALTRWHYSFSSGHTG